MNQKLNYMESFDKEKAFDELGKLMALPPESSISECMAAMRKGQNYLNDIYLKGYKEGLEKNLSLTSKKN